MSARTPLKAAALCSASRRLRLTPDQYLSSLQLRRKRTPQPRIDGMTRGRNSSGASSWPSHLRIFNGTPGAPQGSAWLGDMMPPLAKLVSIAALDWRSTTVTAWPWRCR